MKMFIDDSVFDRSAKVEEYSESKSDKARRAIILCGSTLSAGVQHGATIL
jgi:hypothetical protein